MILINYRQIAVDRQQSTKLLQNFDDRFIYRSTGGITSAICHKQTINPRALNVGFMFPCRIYYFLRTKKLYCSFCFVFLFAIEICSHIPQTHFSLSRWEALDLDYKEGDTNK